MNKNIVYNKTDSIEMDIFYETNGTNPSLKSVAKKKKKWKKRRKWLYSKRKNTNSS